MPDLKKSITTFLLTICTVVLFAQSSYNISVKIDGNKDSSMFLTSYYGKKVVLVDTARLVDEGNFVFEGNKHLAGGIYMVVSPAKSKLFEFVVGEDQVFELITDTIDFAMHMKVVGSDENRVFYEYLHHNERAFKESARLKKMLEADSLSGQETAMARMSLDSLNKNSVDYKLNVIEQYPDYFVSTLFNAMREVEVPEEVKSSADSSAAFKYYKEHYWDYIRLNDSTLMRTPLLGGKVDTYMDQLVYFHPDSVIVAIDNVVARARPSDEMVGFLVWHFLSTYQNPKYMGFDKVFVHLVDQYFTQEDIINTTPSVLKMLKDRADALRPILIGESAPNMILIDTTGQLQSLYSIPNTYTLVLFWDYDCGICKREMVVLKELFDSHKFDMQVFAVSVNGDLAKWKKTIDQRNLTWLNVNGTRSATPDFHDLYDVHGTPVLFVLDKEKRIIAKNIGAEQVEQVLSATK